MGLSMVLPLSSWAAMAGIVFSVSEIVETMTNEIEITAMTYEIISIRELRHQKPRTETGRPFSTQVEVAAEEAEIAVERTVDSHVESAAAAVDYAAMRQMGKAPPPTQLLKKKTTSTGVFFVAKPTEDRSSSSHFALGKNKSVPLLLAQLLLLLLAFAAAAALQR